MRASAKIEEFVSVMYQAALIITVTLVACDMFLSGAYQSNNMYSKTCHVPVLLSQFEHTVFPFLTWIKRHGIWFPFHSPSLLSSSATPNLCDDACICSKFLEVYVLVTKWVDDLVRSLDLSVKGICQNTEFASGLFPSQMY